MSPPPPPPPRGMENRRTPRFTARMSAEVRHDGRVFTAVTRDLSTGGVCLESERLLPEGDGVLVGLFLVVDDVEDATQPPLEMRGKVAWCAPGEDGARGTMGVRFEGITAGQLTGLSRYLKIMPPT